MNCHCVSLAMGQLSTNRNNHMNPHAITYCNQSGPILLSSKEDWRWPVCLLPWPASCPYLILLIHLAPYPQLDSTALNDVLLVNNKSQRKWLGLFCNWAKLRHTSSRIAGLWDETVSEGSRIHSYQLKDVQSHNSTDYLICYIPPTQDVFTRRKEKAENLLRLPGPLLTSVSSLISYDI
jgi:hypothetical protein